MQIAHRRAVYFRDWSWKGIEAWDGLIDLCSGCGGFCHTELLFKNGKSFTSTTQFDASTVVYPSPRSHGGPIIRRINFVNREWLFTDVPVSDKQESEMYDACIKLIDESVAENGGYDFTGVARFVFPFMQEHKKDWFCTESVVHILQTKNFFRGMKAWTISPNRLVKLCQNGVI